METFTYSRLTSFLQHRELTQAAAVFDLDRSFYIRTSPALLFWTSDNHLSFITYILLRLSMETNGSSEIFN